MERGRLSSSPPWTRASYSVVGAARGGQRVERDYIRPDGVTPNGGTPPSPRKRTQAGVGVACSGMPVAARTMVPCRSNSHHPRSHPSHRRRGALYGTLVQIRGEGAAARRRRRIPRRGHPRRHQGAAAVGRELCRRLPGRPGVAPARRAGGRAGHHVRARHPSRNLHQRGLRRRDARRLHQLSAARGGHLEVDRRHQRRRRCALQPRLAGRDRRRHDHHRRGLWRGRERHPGTLLCLRDEVLDVAHRSAPGLAHHRALRRGRLRALRGEPRPCHAGAAHPRLPRHRLVRGEGQPRRRLFGNAAPCPGRRGSITRGLPIRR